MRRPPIGDQELALLRYVAERGPQSVGEVALGFGEPAGLARTTVLTVMERLRRKGYLRRRQQDGVYRYHSPLAAGDLLRGVVGDFVHRVLHGSVVPVVSYLIETEELSDDEVAELETLVERLRRRRGR